MPVYTHANTLTSTSRADIRNEVTSWFLSELPGNGKGPNCSHNIYTVENYNGLSITLNRPAGLNKGFDFVVNLNGMFFKGNRRHRNPSHTDIIDALIQVYSSNPSFYSSTIKPIIHDIYNCVNVTFTPSSLASFTDYAGNQQPIEIILLAIKWLFIEQDITYWNWSGRQMLYSSLQSKGLV